MALPTSPAVVFLERDNSSYPPNIDSSIVGIVGFASKGPTNKPVLVTSPENLIKIFGNPSENYPGQGLEGALEILETTNQARYVRVAPDDAAYASALVSFGVPPAVKITGGNWGLGSSLYLAISVSDSNGVRVLDNEIYAITSSTENQANNIGQASAMAKVIGDGTNPADHVAVIFDSTTTGTGYIVSKWAGSNAGLSISAASGAIATGDLAGYPDPAKLTSAILPMAWDGNAGALASSVWASGGATITTGTLAYLAKSLYVGDGYNLGTNSKTGQTSGVSIETESIGGPDTTLSVNYEGLQSESYVVNLLNGTKYIEDMINVGTDNSISDYIQGELFVSGSTSLTPGRLAYYTSQINGIATNGVTVTDQKGVNVTGVSPRFVKPIEGTFNLSGGTNGTFSTTKINSAVIGSNSTKTGMYALDDDTLNISMAIMPGINDQQPQNALITLAETSQNFIAVVAPPFAANTVEEAVDWMNGRGGLGRTASINSSWVAVYWPWVQVYNTFDQKDMWYDPSIFAIRQMAYTDGVAETWFAPAGFRRGRLTKPTATEVALNQGDRDILYVNNINPVASFNPEGITIFGQKTGQRTSTALDRVNVRRLMIYLRKVLLATGREDLFEPNDAFTWEIIKDKADAVLSDIQARRGVTDFRVICDETTNTPIRVDRNELWCKILLKPTKTAEWIVFEVNLTGQAAKFNG